MKIAVINFSGNVGKTTVSRHLLLPRIPEAELISIESINASSSGTDAQTLRGRQFGALQEYLQTIESAVVDIGASNVEDLLNLMQAYRGSHADFDYFIVPTVPAIKQQKDTIATLVDLAQLGVPAERIKVIFNMVEAGTSVKHAFYLVDAFLAEHLIATGDIACSLGANELYERLRGTETDLRTLARDPTDFKALIAQAPGAQEKLALAQRLATCRLASGIVPELDACFAALQLKTLHAFPGDTGGRETA